MTDITNGADAPTAPSAVNKLYFAAWRWHFYAGLYAAPFLVMLACTGLIMLWISFFAGLGDEKTTVAPGDTPIAISALQAAAEAAIPGGTATQYVAPLAPDHVAAFAVAANGTVTGVTLNPFTGEVLHTFPWRAGLYDLANDIHGTLFLGITGDRMIEAAASLALLLVATGLYLHWPRNGAGWRRALIPGANARAGRNLWKSLHGAIGLWMSALMIVFLISGLSWAGIWGEKMVQAWSTFPAAKWDNVPLSDDTHASMNHGNSNEVPWNLEQTPLPLSGSLAGTTAITGRVTLDSVAAFADSLGFDHRYQLTLPRNAAGVWTISHDSMSNDGPDPTADRTIHIDQYTGNVLADVQYSDYSAYAKAMAWGVAFHEGDLGAWNFVLNTLFCVAMIFLPVSGLVMWWKRRPPGAARLAAPPAPAEVPYAKGAILITLALSLAFPVLGLTLLAVIALDLLILTPIPALRRVFN